MPSSCSQRAAFQATFAVPPQCQGSQVFACDGQVSEKSLRFLRAGDFNLRRSAALFTEYCVQYRVDYFGRLRVSPLPVVIPVVKHAIRPEFLSALPRRDGGVTERWRRMLAITGVTQAICGSDREVGMRNRL